MNYSDEALFENLLRIWLSKGRQPVRRDLDSETATISQSPYNRRFKSWTEALRCCVAWANEADKADITADGSIKRPRRTSRDPSLRLRYRVMKRDHFSCVKCGRSPARDKNVELHVDHIQPWSKGGETEIENLQTLCRVCNIGKGDLENE